MIRIRMNNFRVSNTILLLLVIIKLKMKVLLLFSFWVDSLFWTYTFEVKPENLSVEMIINIKILIYDCYLHLKLTTRYILLRKTCRGLYIDVNFCQISYHFWRYRMYLSYFYKRFCFFNSLISFSLTINTFQLFSPFLANTYRW